MPYSNRDQDKSKGATEDDGRIGTVPGNTSLPGQLGHRDPDPIIKSSDTDFPEPGENPEHSGEPTVEDKDIKQKRSALDLQRRTSGLDDRPSECTRRNLASC